MTDQELVAGAPVVHPGRVGGVGPIHLGRTEARKNGHPALVGICNDALHLPLQRIPEPRWWRRWRQPRWCLHCSLLRDYLRGQ